jgi:ubiquinone/menaquinone biosynthesis C-methylase UbiE
MIKFANQTYLRTEQYRDASNLNARIVIHERFSTNPQGWFPWVWDTLTTLPASAKVLELGCGSGALWMSCPERIPAGWDISVSDFSPGMLDAAWRNLVTLKRGFKFEQIDAQAIPYLDESLDVIIANHMLYHVPDRPKALEEIHRVLKPGGMLVATTVGKNHLKELNAWLKGVSLNTDFEPFSNPFVLENGSEQLQPFFTPIVVKRYEDSLRITEIDPLMAYIRSSIRATLLSEAALQTMKQDLKYQLEKDGALLVTKDSGMFEAKK